MTKKHSVEYVREFCLRKNIILMQDYYSGNKIRLKLKCAVDGYEWNARFDSLAGMNSGCPKCAKNIALTEQDLIDECLRKNIKILSSFSRIGEMLFGCEICGFEWKTRFKCIFKTKIGCFKCAGTRKPYSNEEVEEILLKANLTLLSNYESALKKVLTKCLMCGYNSTITLKAILKGSICKICSKTSYIHEYIEKQFLHKNIILLSKYIDALTYNKVKCSICGYEWDTKWNYVQQGCGCNKCAIERNAEKSRHSLEFVKNECLKRNILFLDNFYFRNNESHNLQCLRCNFEWPANFNSIYNLETSCPSCAHHVSRGERLVLEWAQSNLSHLFDIFPRDRRTIKPYEIDISLKSEIINIAIHYNGGCHYKPVFGSTEEIKINSLIKTQKNDKIKEEMLRKIGWRTIVLKNEKDFSKPKTIKSFNKILKEINGFLYKTSEYKFVEIEIG